MPYQTSTISSAADYVSAINAFAVANGWTLTLGVLTKADSHIKILNESANDVTIKGGRSGVFTGAEVATSSVRFTAWPTSVQLELFYGSSPDTIWAVLHWKPGYYIHMGFGVLHKYGTWTGGTWIHGQHADQASIKDDQCYSIIDGDSSPYAANYPTECGLFWSPYNRSSYSGTYTDNAASKLHCELRGYIWEGSVDQTPLGRILCPSVLTPIHKLNPNLYNGQTILTPYELFILNADGHNMNIGHVGHLRFVRLNNYNPEDILTIASEEWKIYPMLRKDPVFPDGYGTGSFSAPSTGLQGIAIRYDGP